MEETWYLSEKQNLTTINREENSKENERKHI